MKHPHRLPGPTLILVASLLLITGCGGDPPMVDTAETTRPEPAKPASTPDVVPTPEAAPAKDAPKP